METKRFSKGLLIPVFLLIFTGCAIPFETATSSHFGVRVEYENPAWAPPYHSGVRYYYFPDIEVYYDLANHDFIFLNDGRWYFSRTLPPYYADYDLFRGFVISLNVRVFEPWRHHQYYVASYPRYYYRSFYRQRHDHDWIRGFNENDRHPSYRNGFRPGDKDRDGRVYNPGVGRDDYRGYNKDNRKDDNERYRNDNPQGRSDDNRSSRYDNDNSNPNNQQGQGRNEGVNRPSTPNTPTDNKDSGRNSSYSREPQESNYYGRRVGRPVTVERQMREPKASKSENKSDSRSSGGRR